MSACCSPSRSIRISMHVREISLKGGDDECPEGACFAADAQGRSPDGLVLLLVQMAVQTRSSPQLRRRKLRKQALFEGFVCELGQILIGGPRTMMTGNTFTP